MDCKALRQRRAGGAEGIWELSVYDERFLLSSSAIAVTLKNWFSRMTRALLVGFRS